jgi:hypothetical protein
MKFRKKPVVIEAIKWNGENLREIIDFTGLHPSAEKWTWDEYAEVVSKEGLKIFTIEGPLMASIGDWIIQGVKGEFYPCKPDIFEATYEPVEEFKGRGAAMEAVLENARKSQPDVKVLVEALEEISKMRPEYFATNPPKYFYQERAKQALTRFRERGEKP